MESPPVVREYFLGICEMEVIMKWRLCSTILENLRPNDCTFNNETITDGVRVHRRLCDISNLAYYGEPCRCDMILANRTMYKVDGMFFEIASAICFALSYRRTNILSLRIEEKRTFCAVD